MAGIDIGVHRSDRRARVGKLTRQGSPQLRWALYEAALAASRPTDQPSRHRPPRHGRGPDKPGHPRSDPERNDAQPLTTGLAKGSHSDSASDGVRTASYWDLARADMVAYAPYPLGRASRRCS